MIVSLPGMPITLQVGGYPTDLTIIGARLLDGHAAEIVGRVTLPQTSPGTYAEATTAPNDTGRYFAVYDRGTPYSPSTVAVDVLDVTMSGDDEAPQPGDDIFLLFVGFPGGLVGTIGVTVLDSAGNVVAGRTTSNIIELLPDSGAYVARVAAPGAGSYSAFADTGGVAPVTWREDFVVAAQPAPLAWEPTVAEVAARVPMRPRDNYGRLETFTSETQPTERQVQTIIDTIIARLTGRFGTPPDALIGVAKEIATLEAAMRVELDFFADQVQAGRSPYNELVALHEKAMAEYLVDRSELGSDDTPGTADDNAPIYSFPPTSDLLTECAWRGPVW